MATSRTRTRLAVSATRQQIKRRSYGSEYTYTTNLFDLISDVVGNPDGENPLYLVTYKGVLPHVYRYNWTYIYVGHVKYATVNNWKTNHLEPSDEELATQLLAATNPSRVDFSLPLFFYELREFPRLLRNEGDTLIERGASANLNYQFGWKPLINDLLSMLDFIEAAEQRARELENLAKSGLRRRRTLWKYKKTGEDALRYRELGYAEYNTGGYFDYVTEQDVKIWGTVTWYPSPSFLKSRSTDRINHARWLAAGMSSSQLVTNLWNAIPWSWLIDWFINVGAFLEATNNAIAVTHRPPNIMRNRKYRLYTENFVAAHVATRSFLQNDGDLRIEEKTRSQPSASLVASMPFLTGRQWSILGSLYILKTK